MSCDQIHPKKDRHGVPFCTEEECCQYDGKRCRAMGFRPHSICEPAVQQMATQAKQARADSESWRKAELAWQDWAKELLNDLGRQPLHGEHGDGPAREIIAQLAGMAPGVPRCLRCGCFASRHEVDDEELRECADCECTGFESPAAGTSAGNSTPENEATPGAGTAEGQ